MATRTDNFNRADSASSLGTPSDGGSGYTTPAGGTWGINANRAYQPGGGSNSVALLEASASDVEVQFTLSNVTAGDQGGLIGRYVDGNNYYHAAFYEGIGFKLWKWSGGSATQLGTTNAANPTSGDVIKFRMSGTTLTLFRNGTALTGINGITDSGPVGTRHGMHNNVAGSLIYDDLSITDLNAGSGGSSQQRRGPLLGFC